ncbi:MAG: hypothetical protein LBQ20_11170 [Rhodanobacter sp.]|nr:hypothetical protein [Rhodanobacter sp.]
MVAHAVVLNDASVMSRASANDTSLEAMARSMLSGRWHDYALSAITPQFSWAVLPARIQAPKLLDNYSGDVVRTSLFKGDNASSTRLGVSVATGLVADTPTLAPSQMRHLLGIPEGGLQRTVVAPSLTHDWGERGSLRLTGVLAYQRFASLDLSTTFTSDPFAMAPPRWPGAASYGIGMRVDIGNMVGERFAWNVGYQSRVNMATFSNYRGVFADPGRFDIPASASVDMSYALTPYLGVDISVQRMMYSAITPFTSPSMPTQFLALLGDSVSPVFAWRDLDVYSVGWTLHEETTGNWQLRYTTRQQPVPTSRLLANALAPTTANDTISLGWVRGFGPHSSFTFMTNYTTSPYYLLMPSDPARTNGMASQLEFQTLWLSRF